MRPTAAIRPAPRVVPHGRPSVGPEEETAAIRVLRSGRLAPGCEAARLEGLVARLAGGADAVALASGTLALGLALRAVGAGGGGHVALPSYGCTALLHAARAAGSVPLVCDIDPRTLALDPDALARRAPRGLRAVIVVHPFGRPVPVAPYRALGVPVIEDCAQSPGARLGVRPVGSAGDAAVFSFGPTKLVTCGGSGGALAAAEPGIVRAVRDLATFDQNDDDRPRVNGLMGDLHAAIASCQIGRLPEIVARRRAIASRYDEAFADLGGARPFATGEGRPVHHRYLLSVPGRVPAAVETLASRGIVARRPVYRPLHLLVRDATPCPGAEAAHAALLSLPLSPALEEEEVRQVIDAVRACRF